jgi:hypothetical protein
MGVKLRGGNRRGLSRGRGKQRARNGNEDEARFVHRRMYSQLGILSNENGRSDDTGYNNNIGGSA